MTKKEQAERAELALKLAGFEIVIEPASCDDYWDDGAVITVWYRGELLAEKVASDFIEWEPPPPPPPIYDYPRPLTRQEQLQALIGSYTQEGVTRIIGDGIANALNAQGRFRGGTI